MKKLHSIIALVLCAVLLCACGENAPGGSTPPAQSGEAAYTVTVTDPLGKPWSSGVIVNFLQDGKVAALQPVNAEGAAVKTLPTGDYTVELAFTDSSARYHYDAEGLTLSADKTSLKVVLSQGLSEDYTELNAYSNAIGDYRSYTAYFASAGCTYVPLDTADRTYVQFAPTQSGVYEFSVVGSDARIGYHGSPYFVQTANLAEMTEEGTFTISVSPSMIGTGDTGTTVLVLGIEPNGDADCVISIQRVGEHEMTVEDYPWIIYETTAELSPFTLPENAGVRDFDLMASTDSVKLVLNEADGFYHLGTAEGPVVYARLGSSSGYLDSVETILENSGFARYFYHDDGQFDRKESYTECLMEYIAVMDEATGLYPLTDDLIYIFQQRGEYVGWWDPASGSYLFKDADGNPIPGINAEIAWLFLCCYGEGGMIPSDACPDGHTEVKDAAKAATCTESGLTEGKHCSVCGTVTAAQQTVPATGHSYGAWVQIKAPTADATGLEERTCKICGGKEQKTLPMLGDPQPTVGTPVNEGEPIVIGGVLEFQAEVPAGKYVYYDVYRVSGTTMTIVSDTAYVIYNGKTYFSENGRISIEITPTGMNVPASMAIGNFGRADVVYDVVFTYPLGSYSNPYTMELGSFTTNVEAGNDQGVYYTYTAASAGTLTLTLDSITEGVSGGVTLYNLTTYQQVGIESGSGTNTVSIAVNAGDVIQITVSVLPNAKHEYPAATIRITAALR